MCIRMMMFFVSKVVVESANEGFEKLRKNMRLSLCVVIKRRRPRGSSLSEEKTITCPHCRSKKKERSQSQNSYFQDILNFQETQAKQTGHRHLIFQFQKKRREKERATSTMASPKEAVEISMEEGTIGRPGGGIKLVSPEEHEIVQTKRSGGGGGTESGGTDAVESIIKNAQKGGGSVGTNSVAASTRGTNSVAGASAMEAAGAPRKSRNAVKSGVTTSSDRQRIQEEKKEMGIKVILPWSKKYSVWWYFTVTCAVITIFTESYYIAFAEAGLAPYGDFNSVFEYALLFVFCVDIFVNFQLAYYDDETDDIVLDRYKIAKNYLSWNFIVDIIGIFPFYAVALAIFGKLGDDDYVSRNLALLRLTRMVRLRRMKRLFDDLQYNPHVSLMWLTLCRNFAFAIVWSHFAACAMYFIARQYDFDPDNTWIGGSLQGKSIKEQYLTSMYWSVTTFTTVGYGDFSPVNSTEQIWGMVYMLLNIILQAWVIGSITLLIVRQDEKTGQFRESLHVLNQYARINDLDKAMHKGLKAQLQLEFKSKDISDEEVLKSFPSVTRRKVLRKLYLPYLIQTDLMKGLRQQFVDAFLSACTVEIFSQGEEILTRGTVASDLYLLVGGTVKVLPLGADNKAVGANDYESTRIGTGTSVGESDHHPDHAGNGRVIDAGEGFINEIAFFTESPQVDTVRTVTVCKTLTMSQAAYQQLSADQPGSVGIILKNLLRKAEEEAQEYKAAPPPRLPERIASCFLLPGSVFNDDSERDNVDISGSAKHVQSLASLTAVQDLVKMHLHQVKDDHTTRFLYLASRDDTDAIELMCDQGFDPNSADYDHRTALMIAAAKGNTETVEKLLEFDANPNLVDSHGSSPLYEATKNGHLETMDVLLKHGAQLCLDEGEAGVKLCQLVADGKMLQLQRFIKAQIPVNAVDYDKRTPAHIAASEGHVAALRVLVQAGADFKLKDRWGFNVYEDAKRSGNNQTALFVKKLEEEQMVVDA